MWTIVDYMYDVIVHVRAVVAAMYAAAVYVCTVTAAVRAATSRSRYRYWVEKSKTPGALCCRLERTSV